MKETIAPTECALLLVLPWGLKMFLLFLIHALDSVVNLPSLSDILLESFDGYDAADSHGLAFLDTLNPYELYVQWTCSVVAISLSV